MEDVGDVIAGGAIDGGIYRTMLDSLYDGVYLVDPQRKILYWNHGAERLSGFPASEVVGTSCADDILCHVDAEGTRLCRELCPLARTLQDAQERECEVFLHHRDGHRVPIAIRVSPILDPAGDVVAAVEVFNDASPRQLLREQVAELTRLASIDALTDLPNRRFAEAALESCLTDFQRYGWSFGLLFVDIDHFKRFNDTYGHDVGDEVLKMVAKTLAASVRSSDVVARWGGEEFVVLLKSADEESIQAYAERCRAMVECSRLRAEGRSAPESVTVSIGGTLGRSEDTSETIVARADEMMYSSKAAGRNRARIG